MLDLDRTMLILWRPLYVRERERERAGFVFQISLGIVERSSFVNACVSTNSRQYFFFFFHGNSEGEEAGVPFIQSITDTCWGIISQSSSEPAPNTGPAGLGAGERSGVGCRGQKCRLIPRLMVPRLNCQGHLEACSLGCCCGEFMTIFETLRFCNG